MLIGSCNPTSWPIHGFRSVRSTASSLKSPAAKMWRSLSAGERRPFEVESSKRWAATLSGEEALNTAKALVKQVLHTAVERHATIVAKKRHVQKQKQDEKRIAASAKKHADQTEQGARKEIQSLLGHVIEQIVTTEHRDNRQKREALRKAALAKQQAEQEAKEEIKKEVKSLLKRVITKIVTKENYLAKRDEKRKAAPAKKQEEQAEQKVKKEVKSLLKRVITRIVTKERHLQKREEPQMFALAKRQEEQAEQKVKKEVKSPLKRAHAAEITATPTPKRHKRAPAAEASAAAPAPSAGGSGRWVRVPNPQRPYTADNKSHFWHNVATAQVSWSNPAEATGGGVAAALIHPAVPYNPAAPSLPAAASVRADRPPAAAAAAVATAAVATATTAFAYSKPSLHQAAAYNGKPAGDEIETDRSGRRTYRCPTCDRKFTHPPALSSHMRLHAQQTLEEEHKQRQDALALQLQLPAPSAADSVTLGPVADIERRRQLAQQQQKPEAQLKQQRQRQRQHQRQGWQGRQPRIFVIPAWAQERHDRQEKQRWQAEAEERMKRKRKKKPSVWPPTCEDCGKVFLNMNNLNHHCKVKGHTVEVANPLSRTAASASSGTARGSSRRSFREALKKIKRKPSKRLNSAERLTKMAKTPEPEALYCICQKPPGEEDYVGCEGCNGWFHFSCCKCQPEDFTETDPFFCPTCNDSYFVCKEGATPEQIYDLANLTVGYNEFQEVNKRKYAGLQSRSWLKAGSALLLVGRNPTADKLFLNCYPPKFKLGKAGASSKPAEPVPEPKKAAASKSIKCNISSNLDAAFETALGATVVSPAKKATHAPAGTAGDTWACCSCTFINAATATFCDVCDRRRPSGRQRQPPPVGPGGRAEHTNAGITTAAATAKEVSSTPGRQSHRLTNAAIAAPATLTDFEMAALTHISDNLKIWPAAEIFVLYAEHKANGYPEAWNIELADKASEKLKRAKSGQQIRDFWRRWTQRHGPMQQHVCSSLLLEANRQQTRSPGGPQKRKAPPPPPPPPPPPMREPDDSPRSTRHTHRQGQRGPPNSGGWFPKSEVCPISLAPMTNPMQSSECGHVFERDSIQQWIRTNDVTGRELRGGRAGAAPCPVCRVPVRLELLHPPSTSPARIPAALLRTTARHDRQLTGEQPGEQVTKAGCRKCGQCGQQFRYPSWRQRHRCEHAPLAPPRPALPTLRNQGLRMDVRTKNGRDSATASSRSTPATHFEVERILAKRHRAGKLELEVKWAGFPSTNNTWEPASNLSGVLTGPAFLYGPKIQSKKFEVEKISAKRHRAGKLELEVKWAGFPNTANTWEPASNLPGVFTSPAFLKDVKTVQ